MWNWLPPTDVLLKLAAILVFVVGLVVVAITPKLRDALGLLTLRVLDAVTAFTERRLSEPAQTTRYIDKLGQ